MYVHMLAKMYVCVSLFVSNDFIVYSCHTQIHAKFT